MRKYIFFIVPVVILCGAVFFYLMFNVLLKQNDFYPEPADFIVILGHSLDDGETPSEWLVQRMKEGLRLYNLGYAGKIVTTGGQPKHYVMSVAQSMKNWLIANGVPPEDILIEEQASNTYENFKFTRELIGDTPIIVVTNDFHMYRSMLIANDYFQEVSGSSAHIPMDLQKSLAYGKEPLSVIKYIAIHKE